MSARSVALAAILAIIIGSLARVESAHSTQVVVPDDFPTIAQALSVDPQPDTVFVRPGKYDEVVDPPYYGGKPLLIAAMPVPSLYFDFETTLLPKVKALRSHSAYLTVRGICFASGSTIEGGHEPTAIESCRFDSSLTVTGSGWLVMRHCTIYGAASLSGGPGEISANTIIGGSLTHIGTQGTVLLHDNIVVGPAEVGIRGSLDTYITDNYVRGCVTGIVTWWEQGSGSVVGNVVEDCSGTGYSVRSWEGSSQSVSDNVARRCGGRGFDILNLNLARNRVESSGREGIYVSSSRGVNLLDNIVLNAGEAGIVVATDAAVVRGNRIVRAGAAGMRFRGGAVVDSNVVGHCAGDGIVRTAAAEPLGAAMWLGNTIYSNASSGIVHSGDTPDVFHQNILYGGGRYGLEWQGPDAPILGCNDYYANSLGMTAGVSPAIGDMSIEPLFCDVTQDAVALRADSPLLHAPGCPPIGAIGVGCPALAGSPAGVGNSARFGIDGVKPNPTTHGFVISFMLPTGQPARLELLDLAGRRVFDRELSAPTPGAQTLSIGGEAQLVPGFYVVRLSQGARQATAKTTVIR